MSGGAHACSPVHGHASRVARCLGACILGRQCVCRGGGTHVCKCVGTRGQACSWGCPGANTRVRVSTGACVWLQVSTYTRVPSCRWAHACARVHLAAGEHSWVGTRVGQGGHTCPGVFMGRISANTRVRVTYGHVRLVAGEYIHADALLCGWAHACAWLQVSTHVWAHVPRRVRGVCKCQHACACEHR